MSFEKFKAEKSAEKPKSEVEKPKPEEKPEEKLTLEESGYIEDVDQKNAPDGYVGVYNPFLDTGAFLKKEDWERIKKIQEKEHQATERAWEQARKEAEAEMTPEQKEEREELRKVTKAYARQSRELEERGYKYDPFEDNWKLVDPGKNEKWKAEHPDIVKQREQEYEELSKRVAEQRKKEEEMKKKKAEEEVILRKQEEQKKLEKEAEARQKREDRIARKAKEAGMSPEEYVASRRAGGSKEVKE